MAGDGQSEGPATDRHNEPVVDPTKNVLDLVQAAVDRLNDITDLNAKWSEKLHDAESDHVRELLALRADHAKDLRQAETARVDAIRAVDVGNVQRAAEVQATQAQTLAAQVTLSAETLRTQVAATATAWEARLIAALDPIQKDIQDLRKAQYEAQGQKTQVVETRGAADDMKPYFDQIQTLLLNQAANQGGKAQVVETRADQRSNSTLALSIIGAVIVVLTFAMNYAFR